MERKISRRRSKRQSIQLNVEYSSNYQFLHETGIKRANPSLSQSDLTGEHSWGKRTQLRMIQCSLTSKVPNRRICDRVCIVFLQSKDFVSLKNGMYKQSSVICYIYWEQSNIYDLVHFRYVHKATAIREIGSNVIRWRIPNKECRTRREYRWRIWRTK